MAVPYKISITEAGASTDSFNILYEVAGINTYYTASSPCGTPAIYLTQDQLLSGYVVNLPENVVNVYIQHVGGICDGLSSPILLPG